MSTNINKEHEGTVALFTGGSGRIGATIVEGLAADGADAASALVTNGVQQVLRLSTAIAKAVSER